MGRVAPDAYKAIRDLQGFVDKLNFPKKLVELVKIELRNQTAANIVSTCIRKTPSHSEKVLWDEGRLLPQGLVL